MKTILKYFLTISLLTVGLVLGSATRASADSTAKCLYQYSSKGFTTSATPVFNSTCNGVPEGINNETNFVRLRQSANGNDEDNLHNSSYSVGSLSASCNSGLKYDVWNYVDNDASTLYNPGMGSGSAVAKNTDLNLSYQDNSTNGSFTFNAIISATNASSVTDTAVLKCNAASVKLFLVPGSVHIYSIPYGNWEDLPDSSVNTSFPIGSTNAGLSSLGSGQMWGGWTYRIVVVYQVEATVTKPKVVQPTCNSISLTQSKDSAKVTVSYSAGSSTVSGIDLHISSSAGSLTKTLEPNQLPYIFELSPSVTYTVKAEVLTNLSDVTSQKCSSSITGAVLSKPSSPKTPATPAQPAKQSTTKTTSASSELVNTGPGNTALIFITATVIGSITFYLFQKRRLKISK